MLELKVKALAPALLAAAFLLSESAEPGSQTDPGKGLGELQGGPKVPASSLEAAQLTAIGDVHGDLKTFRMLLRSVGLIDSRDRWCGGSRHLIQTGDLVDRGDESRQVLDLILRLEKEAKAAGGQVIVLLGNHEVMCMTGDFTYTTRKDFLSFEGDEKPPVRAQRQREILRLVREGSPLIRSGYFRELSRVLDEKTFDRIFPPGYFARQEAFSPEGRYGRWLLERPAIHRENGTLFLHGGLSSRYGDWTIDRLNGAAREGIVTFLEGLATLEELGAFHRALGASELSLFVQAERAAGKADPALDRALRKIEEAWKGVPFDSEGPLWYRGLALEGEWRLEPFVAQVLTFHGASRMVIGHTQTQLPAIESRFGNRVILIDTGMCKAVYAGRPSALFVSPDGGIRVWR